VETVGAGQHDVDEDDVGWAAAEDGQAVLATRGLAHGASFLLEDQPEGSPHVLVIFNEEDARRHQR
jgi:hypothetical protein